MLLELSVVEQRYQAVLAVIRDGVPIVEVAHRFDVSRQAVHRWLGWYEAQGLPGLVDRSHRPPRCSHQMDPSVEVWALEARRRNPDWGPRRLVHEAARAGIEPIPSRSGVYRALKRAELIDPGARRRRDRRFRRWERGGSMELWQMDVVGGVLLERGAEAKILTGIDDHSRFVVCSGLMLRATSRAVCTHLAALLPWLKSGREGAIHRRRVSDHECQFGEGIGKAAARTHIGPEIIEAPCGGSGRRHGQR